MEMLSATSARLIWPAIPFIVVSHETESHRLHGPRLARPRPGPRRAAEVRPGRPLLRFDRRHDGPRPGHGGQGLSLPDREPADHPRLFLGHRERPLLHPG